MDTGVGAVVMVGDNLIVSLLLIHFFVFVF